MKQVLILFVGAIAVACSTAKAADTIRRPNILVLLTDDQRWDSIGCVGNDIIQTPNLDQLASDGAYFPNAFLTSSVCAASRASIFTGLYERTHGANFHTGPLKKSYFDDSYPAILRRAGYYIGFIGKYGIGDGDRDFHGEQVFDYWRGFYAQGEYFSNDRNAHLTQHMGQQAIEFLASTEADKPFCLSISFKAPHSGKGYLGFEPDPSMKSLYQDVQIPKPRTASQEHFDALPDFLQRSNAKYNYWKLRYSTDEQFQNVMRDYYRLITGVDRAIGMIRAELARRDLAKNTIIVFLSDNGEMTGDYLLGGKKLLYDASIRIPMIVYDPRQDQVSSARSEQMVLNIDVAPTILDYAGAEIPTGMQGKSLVPLVNGREVKWRDAFLCENHFHADDQYYPMIEGVRTRDWKYVRYPETTPVFEQLFSLKSDPDETKNLAYDANFTDQLKSLRKRCDALIAAASD
jgi:alpha-L-rhamnosidase